VGKWKFGVLARERKWKGLEEKKTLWQLKRTTEGFSKKKKTSTSGSEG